MIRVSKKSIVETFLLTDFHLDFLCQQPYFLVNPLRPGIVMPFSVCMLLHQSFVSLSCIFFSSRDCWQINSREDLDLFFYEPPPINARWSVSFYNFFFNYKGFYLLNNSINYQSDDTRLFTKDFDVGNLEALEFK